MDLVRLIEHLRFEEGVVPHAYQDHLGYWTIGIGHLIDRRRGGRISDRIINAILEEDLTNVFDDLDRNVPWWRDLSQGAQLALASMCFQMGWPSLSKFQKMLAALKASQYELAASEAMDSQWAKQTPDRAKRVVDMIRG